MRFIKRIPHTIIINTTTKIKFIRNKGKSFSKNINKIKNIPDKPKFLPDYDEYYIEQIIRNGGL